MYVIAYKVYTTTLNSLILSNIQKQSNKSNRTLHIRICIYFLAAAWCISRVLIFVYPIRQGRASPRNTASSCSETTAEASWPISSEILHLKRTPEYHV